MCAKLRVDLKQQMHMVGHCFQFYNIRFYFLIKCITPCATLYARRAASSSLLASLCPCGHSTTSGASFQLFSTAASA
ncbi:MAG: hypothetical protein LBG43_10525, partial [Treponema sp.]|nr:hypothetical protein [Treponema sp.]